MGLMATWDWGQDLDFDDQLLAALTTWQSSSFPTGGLLGCSVLTKSSPLIAYSAKDATSQWRATYAMQGDNFDQTLHTTTTSQASLKFNISGALLRFCVMLY